MMPPICGMEARKRVKTNWGGDTAWYCTASKGGNRSPQGGVKLPLDYPMPLGIRAAPRRSATAVWRWRGGFTASTAPAKVAKKEENKMKKSQVTQSKNPELEWFQNSQIQTRKTRFFSLMTYASEKQIQRVMRDHIKSVRAFCYIYHDKDEAEPHHHIMIRTHSTWTPPQLARWFAGLVDGDKKPINTFCESANDTSALEEYFTHTDEKSKEAGKYQYKKEDIKDFGLWDIVDRKESYDDCLEIVNKILLGVSYRELVRQYGRKFLYHWDKYADIAVEIRQDEGYREARQRALTDLYGTPVLKNVDNIEEV